MKYQLKYHLTMLLLLSSICLSKTKYNNIFNSLLFASMQQPPPVYVPPPPLQLQSPPPISLYLPSIPSLSPFEFQQEQRKQSSFLLSANQIHPIFHLNKYPEINKMANNFKDIYQELMKANFSKIDRNLYQAIVKEVVAQQFRGAEKYDLLRFLKFTTSSTIVSTTSSSASTTKTTTTTATTTRQPIKTTANLKPSTEFSSTKTMFSGEINKDTENTSLSDYSTSTPVSTFNSNFKLPNIINMNLKNQNSDSLVDAYIKLLRSVPKRRLL
jgi:hypothetical protein